MISFDELKREIKITVGLLIAIIAGAWFGFTEYDNMKEQQQRLDTLEQRMDKRHKRTQEAIEDHEKRLRDLE